VRKLIIPVSLGMMCVSFTIIPPKSSLTVSASTIPPAPVSDSVSATGMATLLYEAICLQQYGLSKPAFEYAWKGYQYLLAKGAVKRTGYITICDFSQSSRQKRLYIIDINNAELITNTWVAHGRNSGNEFATKFSNTPESLQSSLGFYVTAQTYTGEHGLSLRINGVDPGFNDKALTRSIVIHGAAYVDGARAKAGIMMGRSFGCPAVPVKESAQIITTIKNGTCLFIYYPSKNYLLRSKILNG
jgi:hypothetical protein